MSPHLIGQALKGCIAVALLGIFSIPTGLAATVVLDSFIQGPFNIEMYIPPTSANYNGFSGPIGTSRLVEMPSPSRALLYMTSTLTTEDGGSMSFDFAMRSGEPVTPSLMPLSYRNGGPYSLLGQAAFEFEFLEFTGAANLIIQVGSEELVNASMIRVPLTGPRTVVAPFDKINFTAGGSLSEFDQIHFLFETASETVAFSMTEIRIIPEPSTTASLCVGLGILALRRRRP